MRKCQAFLLGFSLQKAGLQIVVVRGIMVKKCPAKNRKDGADLAGKAHTAV
jgi:hypothetical protein